MEVDGKFQQKKVLKKTCQIAGAIPGYIDAASTARCLKPKGNFEKNQKDLKIPWLEAEAPPAENEPNPPLVVEVAEAGAVAAPPNIEADVELKI